MKRILIAFLLLILLLSSLWFFADSTSWSAALLRDTQTLRLALLQASGILAIGAMSVAMVLATRPRSLETPLDGLDKMYRLHKWLGITSLLASIAHWLVYGLLTEEKSKIGGIKAMQVAWEAIKGSNLNDLTSDPLQFFLSQYDVALSLGDLMFKFLVVLGILALIKGFPYRTFFKTHFVLAIVYLALAFHSAVLLDSRYWKTPLGGVLGLLLLVGSVSALMVLFRRLIANLRMTRGEIVDIVRYEALHQLRLKIRCHQRWRGHQAGQFAFLTLHKKEGHHPYTITSAGTSPDNSLEFIIKARGDYTDTLPELLKVGDAALIEGPYGRFTFQGKTSRQIWIGAGIGITPFMARLRLLAQAPDNKAIDLFHSTTGYDADFIASLQQEADQAKVRLHVLWDERDGLLDAARIIKEVPEWPEAEIWFCGPAAFGKALKKQLKALGLPGSRFHQELFEMR